jgi:hypothetical protein
VTPRPAPDCQQRGAAGPVLLVVAGGTVSQAAIARTAELAAGAPVTVVGIELNDLSRTGSASCHPLQPGAPEQVRRTVALAMSVLEDSGVVATGHVAAGGPPARAVARVARARGARAVILDQPGTPAGAHPVPAGAGAAGLIAELRRRMYGSGIVVLAETDRRGGWVSA